MPEQALGGITLGLGLVRNKKGIFMYISINMHAVLLLACAYILITTGTEHSCGIRLTCSKHFAHVYFSPIMERS